MWFFLRELNRRVRAVSTCVGVCVILGLSKTSVDVVVGEVVRVRANEMVNNLSLRGKGTALLCDHELLWQPRAGVLPFTAFFFHVLY